MWAQTRNPTPNNFWQGYPRWWRFVFQGHQTVEKSGKLTYFLRSGLWVFLWVFELFFEFFCGAAGFRRNKWCILINFIFYGGYKITFRFTIHNQVNSNTPRDPWIARSRYWSVRGGFHIFVGPYPFQSWFLKIFGPCYLDISGSGPSDSVLDHSNSVRGSLNAPCVLNEVLYHGLVWFLVYLWLDL